MLFHSFNPFSNNLLHIVIYSTYHDFAKRRNLLSINMMHEIPSKNRPSAEPRASRPTELPVPISGRVDCYQK